MAGGGGLEDHLEAAADLHRAVTLLWEGVGDALKSPPAGDRRSGNDAGSNPRHGSSGGDPSGELQAVPLAPAEALPDASGANETAVAVAAAAATDAPRAAATELAAVAEQHATVVSGMLRDQQLFDIPMHLEDSPLPTVTTALSVDAGRVQAAGKFFVSGMLAARSAEADANAAAAAAEAAVAAAAAALPWQTHAGGEAGDTAPLADRPPDPTILAISAPAAPPPAALRPQALPPDDDEAGSPLGSDRQRGGSAHGSEGFPSEGGEEEERVRVSSTASRGGARLLSEEGGREADEEGGALFSY